MKVLALGLGQNCFSVLLSKILIFGNFQSRHVFFKKLFNFAEILHAGQSFHENVLKTKFLKIRQDLTKI